MKHTTMTRLLRRSALVVALLGLLAGTASAQTYDLVADQFLWDGVPMWGFASDTAASCDVGGNVCTSDADCTALVCTYGGNSCTSDTDCLLTDTCDIGTSLCTLGGNACTSDLDCTALDLCDTPDPLDVCTKDYACGTGGAWDFGPTLMADAAGTTASMTVNLRNCLPEAVSIVIPGQPLPDGSAPAHVTDGAGRQRAASFTSEAGASGGTAIYTWDNLKPGTYLYHSGSDPGKQVHMGLYGAAVVNYNGAEAYPGITPDLSLVLVASEVDPDLHGAADPTAKPLNYKPKYFLVNGDASGGTTITGPLVNETVLLRIVNAGLIHYVPNLLGEDLTWVAEDGNPYSYPKTSYSALLAAGKTLDALWTPVTDGPHYLYDRRLHMSTNGAPGGGLIAEINVAVNPDAVYAHAGPDQAVSVYSTPPTKTVVTLAGSASGGAPGYTYQWSFVGFPGSTAPMLSDPTDPAATFTIGEAGAYTLELVATDSATPANVSAPDTVSIVTNLPPVAVASADLTAVEVGDEVQLTGDTSYDPDGDTIEYAWSVSGGTLSSASADNPTWSFKNYCATATTTECTSDAECPGGDTCNIIVVPGTYSASLTVTETVTTDLLSSVPATVQVTVSPAVNDPPVANPDFYTVDKNSEYVDNVFMILANDTDPEGDIDTASIEIVTSPTQGGTLMIFDGYVQYRPRRGWRGTDYFTYRVYDLAGNPSNVASVVVNIK